ncbi:hypothetical protein K9L67_05040 [Candidatus Woesearchaeota archaeon]|nr:hypothetical protein [Candidatus Woesearchaeota archaeon]MCF7901563.1 hypothetical protein [Candidatus Woesearchaeota archaeon]MCF8013325.1 hypothetical protein [Candidatus Woesearchaeota archaeon]
MNYSLNFELRQRYELNMGFYSMKQINQHFSKFQTNFGNLKKKNIIKQLTKINGYLKIQKKENNEILTKEEILSHYLTAQSLYLFHEIIHLDLLEASIERENFKKIVNSKPYKTEKPFRIYFKEIDENTLIEYSEEKFIPIEQTKIIYEPEETNNKFSTKINNRILELTDIITNKKYTEDKHLEFEALTHSISKIFSINLQNKEKINHTEQYLKEKHGFFYLPIPSVLNIN